MNLRHQAADSSNIEWRSDDGSTMVSIPTSLVDRITGFVMEAYRAVPRKGAEAGGLLTGALRIGRVTEILITGFEPVNCDYTYGPSFILSESSMAEFRGVMTHHAAGEVLGYYRSHTRPGFALESSDRELVARIFPGFSGLVLLVKPGVGTNLRGSYYFFQRGTLETRPVGPEFPFAGSVPGGIPPGGSELELEAPAIAAPRLVSGTAQRPQQQRFELNESAVRGSGGLRDTGEEEWQQERGTVETPAVAKRRKSLQWEVAAAGLMIAAALALLWWQYRGDSGEDRGFPLTLPGMTHPAAASVASLGLDVQPGEGGWRISWDANSAAARGAVRGFLNVTEPDSKERIPLDQKQVQEGAATYRPTGNDVVFRLELEGSDNSLASETYRVLLRPEEMAAKPGPKKSAMAPAAPAEDKSAEQKTAGKEQAKAAQPKTEQAAEEKTAGEGYVAPEVLNKVAPEVPEGIRPRITEPQPIDVRVTINREGRVTSATPIQHGEGLVNYLGERAVDAARQWTFSPATQDGKPVSSSRTIHFVFEQ